jgi:hypothetical protein
LLGKGVATVKGEAGAAWTGSKPKALAASGTASKGLAWIFGRGAGIFAGLPGSGNGLSEASSGMLAKGDWGTKGVAEKGLVGAASWAAKGLKPPSGILEADESKFPGV